MYLQSYLYYASKTLVDADIYRPLCDDKLEWIKTCHIGAQQVSQMLRFHREFLFPSMAGMAIVSDSQDVVDSVQSYREILTKGVDLLSDCTTLMWDPVRGQDDARRYLEDSLLPELERGGYACPHGGIVFMHNTTMDFVTNFYPLILTKDVHTASVCMTTLDLILAHIFVQEAPRVYSMLQGMDCSGYYKFTELQVEGCKESDSALDLMMMMNVSGKLTNKIEQVLWDNWSQSSKETPHPGITPVPLLSYRE